MEGRRLVGKRQVQPHETAARSTHDGGVLVAASAASPAGTYVKRVQCGFEALLASQVVPTFVWAAPPSCRLWGNVPADSLPEVARVVMAVAALNGVICKLCRAPICFAAVPHAVWEAAPNVLGWAGCQLRC
eukprot:6192655-Pleurochrysis_carterae.AAC.1